MELSYQKFSVEHGVVHRLNGVSVAGGDEDLGLGVVETQGELPTQM